MFRKITEIQHHRVKWNVAWFKVYSFPQFGKFQIRWRSHLFTVVYKKKKFHSK